MSLFITILPTSGKWYKSVNNIADHFTNVGKMIDFKK